MGVNGVREDLACRTWPLQLRVRHLTGGSELGHLLSRGRRDVRQLRAVKLG